MIDQLQDEALSQVGPDGFTSSSSVTPTGTRAVSMGGMASSGSIASNGPATGVGAATSSVAAPGAMSGTTGTSTGASTDGDGTAPPDFSTTNDQEQGVDEPDLAKTDGSILVALRQSTDTLEVASVSGTPALVGSLDLSSSVQATGLFLTGGDAVVLGSSPLSSTQAAPGTEVVVVDLTNPAQPTVARSFAIQGTYVDSRLVDGTVEVVVTSAPTFAFVSPPAGSTAAIAAATATNQAMVRSSTPANWLPSVTSEPSGVTTVAPCTSAMQATTSSDEMGTVGIVPIDPASDQPGTEVTEVGDATTVYASTSSLYIASPVVSGDSSTPSTAIDAFDLSDPSAPGYAGSAVVPGTLIGQYALSEYDGDLRVATTIGMPNPAPGEGTDPTTPSDNRVTVLGASDGALVPVGSVDGLGEGEKIYAVRFEGPLAYVVTFNQTDPLYVVDLSNPADPQLAGQLPLTGYSSFLEPLGNGLLLGVGQTVNANLQNDGLQVSLFDVSDPSNPTLVSEDDLPYAISSAEQDPHALLYWAQTETVVMPVTEDQPFTSTGPAAIFGPTFVGAVVWTVSGGTLTEAGKISQPVVEASSPPIAQPATGGGGTVVLPDLAPGTQTGVPPQIEQAVVVGDMLYTVSEAGILESDLGTLASETWMAYS